MVRTRYALLALVVACSGTIPSEPRQPDDPEPTPPTPSPAPDTGFGLTVVHGTPYSITFKDSLGRNFIMGSELDPIYSCAEWGGEEAIGLEWARRKFTSADHNSWTFDGKSIPDAPIELFDVGEFCTAPGDPAFISSGTVQYTIHEEIVNNAGVSSVIDAQGTLAGQHIRVHIEDGAVSVTYK